MKKKHKTLNTTNIFSFNAILYFQHFLFPYFEKIEKEIFNFFIFLKKNI